MGDNAQKRADQLVQNDMHSMRSVTAACVCREVVTNLIPFAELGASGFFQWKVLKAGEC